MPLRLAIDLAFYGLLMGAGTLALIQYGVNTYGDDKVARTMGLVAFSFANLFFALCTNDELASIFGRALLANARLLQTSAISLVAIVLSAELDLFNRLLDTTGLTVEQWVLCIAVASIVVWASEIEKIDQAPPCARGSTRGVAPAPAVTPGSGVLAISSTRSSRRAAPSRRSARRAGRTRVPPPRRRRA